LVVRVLAKLVLVLGLRNLCGHSIPDLAEGWGGDLGQVSGEKASGTNPSGALECVIRRGAPAHTIEHINYGAID